MFQIIVLICSARTTKLGSRRIGESGDHHGGFGRGRGHKTVKGTPTTNGKMKAMTGRMDEATIGDIVSQVMLTIQPLFIKVVTSAVATVTKQLMTDMAV